MDVLTALIAGFGVALTPMNLLWGVVGVTLGTLIGVLPGVGPALTVAMLLPLTTKLDPTGALIMFAGIYRVFSNSGMSLERTAVDVAKRVDLLIGDAV